MLVKAVWVVTLVRMALVLHETIVQVDREVVVVALAHILVQTLALPVTLPVKAECRLVMTVVVGVQISVTPVFRGRDAEVDSKFAVVHIVQADKALVSGLVMALTTVVAVVLIPLIIFAQVVILDVTVQTALLLVRVVNSVLILLMGMYVLPVTLVLLVMQTVMPVVMELVMALVMETVMADAIQVVLHTTALVLQVVMYAITASPVIVVAILIVIQDVMIVRVVTALVIQNVMTNAKVG